MKHILFFFFFFFLKKKKLNSSTGRMTVENGVLPNNLRIFIIRHGQTAHNVDKILQGHLDIDLNETGYKQSQLLAESLRKVKFDGFASSDLIRCENTLAEIRKKQSSFEVRYTANFREREMGPVQGMYLKDALVQYGENFRDLGEGKTKFLKRLIKEWNELVEFCIKEDYTNFGLCTHGGVITALVNYLYSDMDYKLDENLTPKKLKVPFNTSVTVIDIDKKHRNAIIKDFGNTTHLGEQLEVKEQLLR